MMKKNTENIVYEYSEEDEDIESCEENQDSEEDDLDDFPVSGSPLYPRIYTGDSARPLSNQYPNSEYVDDNLVGNAWSGVLSYYG